MRGLAIILAATVTTLLAALPAPAIPAREMDPLAREFAYCVGRLSATMEHQWLLSDPASDLTERQRGAIISLLETVSPPDQGGALMTLRLSAKFAHADLLRRAAFEPDARHAEAARHQAEIALGQCLAMILG
jgi:hypothetical protein